MPSSYRHDDEDASRPSVSQAAAVIRPHLRVSQNVLFARTKKRTCVVVAHRDGVRPGSKECSRVLAANCTDIFILSFARAIE